MLLFPNAKINLGLNVTAKRPDGFHNIESVFLPVALCDVLEFVESENGKTNLTVTGTKLDSPPEENLVVKAWQLMHDYFQIPAVEIHLHKLIPTGAGLGGGSADAAFMLKGLNDFFQCAASINELEKMAAMLGSDCAFFIRNVPAYAQGRGEVLEPVEVKLENYSILLINPAIHISTREAYAGVTPHHAEQNLKQLILMNKTQWQQQIKNDFELSVFIKYPAIAAIKDELIAAGAQYASMSGSGSTVYGIFEKDMDIQSLLKSYSQFFYWYGELI